MVHFALLDHGYDPNGRILVSNILEAPCALGICGVPRYSLLLGSDPFRRLQSCRTFASHPAFSLRCQKRFNLFPNYHDFVWAPFGPKELLGAFPGFAPGRRECIEHN